MTAEFVFCSPSYLGEGSRIGSVLLDVGLLDPLDDEHDSLLFPLLFKFISSAFGTIGGSESIIRERKTERVRRMKKKTRFYKVECIEYNDNIKPLTSPKDFVVRIVGKGMFFILRELLNFF